MIRILGIAATIFAAPSSVILVPRAPAAQVEVVQRREVLQVRQTLFGVLLPECGSDRDDGLDGESPV